ncbi:uncharacterized protein LOC117005039 [Catharus ustulatus]|uniref:uncharacterized protein LOC117005039 n=1 Tax=Catharus ustulatus TaxID=91951 RepID=UPI00140AF6B1|nr:uncharacterized protein LOC117005039 [Catharus ustulatus]XP_032932155.1 uncharacterized protein LOC117005039 [Catharus ustulatus]XP_032932156.1 uncharacterized protein LOC117005039 [Catharus ustulatus]
MAPPAEAGWLTLPVAGAGAVPPVPSALTSEPGQPLEVGCQDPSVVVVGGVASPAALPLATCPTHPELRGPSGMPPGPLSCPRSVLALPAAGTYAAPVPVAEPFAPVSMAAASSSLAWGLPSSPQPCAAVGDGLRTPLRRRGFPSESRHSTDPAVSSRSNLWTLPPWSVTVRPKNRRRFWEAVRLRALQQGDWDLLEQLGMPTGEVLRVEEAVQVDSAEFSSVPEGPLPPAGGMEPQEVGGPQAFPVFKAVPGSGQPDRHDPIAWHVVQDLQDKVTRYGLGSTQVMQIIRVLTTDLLAPYDVRHIAQVLFQPVQFWVLRTIGDAWLTRQLPRTWCAHRRTPDMMWGVML